MNPIPDNCDPLMRVVEAFVEQSVPEGPDEATKRRLLATLSATEAPAVLQWAPPVRSRRPVRALAAAATVAAVAAGAYSFGVRQGVEVAKATQKLAIVESQAKVEDDQPDVFAALMESYLQLDKNQTADKADILRVLGAMVQANPRLANSQSWRVAQERLTEVLDRPEMVGLGMGVISTLPLSRFAHF
jgi:hypothetical protein